MNIKSIIKRGKSHLDFCQDALFHFEDNDLIVACVCDGCSEVKDSHFASNLFTKVLKSELNKILAQEYQRAEGLSQTGYADDELAYPTVEIANTILYNFFKKIVKIQASLQLTTNDLAATFIFLLYNKKTDDGIIYVFGDGFLQINNETIIIDHNNVPRYFYVYWNELTKDESSFVIFLRDFEQKWTFSNLENVVISTDGILTFRNEEKLPEEAIDFLVIDEKINEKSIISQNSFFDKKYNKLIAENWSHFDDLGIIRIVK